MWYEVNEPLAIKGIVFNFLPSWWNKNYNLTFGLRYVFDPDYRTANLIFMEKTVAQHFPALHIGSAEPLPAVTMPDFGNVSTPAVAGCEVFYDDVIYPWNTHIGDDKISKLKPPANIAGVFPYTEIVRQTDYLNNKLGKKVYPVLPVRGILNDALLIQGQSFLEDFIGKTKSAYNLLDFVYSILTLTISENHNHFSYSDMVMLCNCTVMMVSPEFYRDNFLQFDFEIQKLVKKYNQKFALHHCGVFDKYASIYRKIPCVDFLAIGWNSDLKLALEMFPEATIQYLISPTFLLSEDADAVAAKINSILKAAGSNINRLRLEVSDIEFGTPQDNLTQIFKCVINYSG
jgi:uroporphyrinogen-III decarboxylase